MKHIILTIVLAAFSLSAFAQFPLGTTKEKIVAYFGEHIRYACAQEFKTDDGIPAICFTKVRVVGDYTFYFDKYDVCTSYTITYDKKELNDLVTSFDKQFCREEMAKWTAHNNKVVVTLLPFTKGANFFSIVYKPAAPSAYEDNTLASN